PAPEIVPKRAVTPGKGHRGRKTERLYRSAGARAKRTSRPRPDGVSAQALAHERGERRDQGVESALELRVPGVRRERRLVHVEPAIDFDLQAVPVLGGPAVAAHNLDALVRIVDRDVVTEAAQRRGHHARELGAARRAVAIAEHEIGARAP